MQSAHCVSETRTSIVLRLNQVSLAHWLEEMVWTLDGVESVTYRLDSDEAIQGLEIIGLSPCLLQDVEQILSTHGVMEQVQLAEVTGIEDADWAESWKQFWHVSRVLPHLVIQPSWETFDPLPGDIVLRLDPGAAFGTGTHDTTQLMLLLLQELLSNRSLKPQTLADVGSGSGILAITAAKWGCVTCLALDTDPLAIAVAQANVRENVVTEQVQCSAMPFEQMAPSQPFDVILANILTPVLIDLLPYFKQALSPGASLALSGISVSQVPQMQAALLSEGFQFTRILQKGDWVALVCQRA